MRQYDDFAADHHWLYSDRGLNGELAIEVNNEILSTTDKEAWILDCSCGIGTLVLALAKRGCKVVGADGSKGMIEQAISAAKIARLNVPLVCSSWEELPRNFSDRFDLVFCLGNSIGHCRSREEMLGSFEGIRKVLRTDGKLVIQSRNWEYLRKEKKRLTHYEWRERAGRRCLPIYIWNFPEEPDAVHIVEVVLIFDAAGRASARFYPTAYYPFRFEQIAECLKLAGFPKLQSDFSQDKAEYRVTAS